MATPRQPPGALRGKELLLNTRRLLLPAIASAAVVAGMCAPVGTAPRHAASMATNGTASYIVDAYSTDAARTAVQRAGGIVRGDLDLINGVTATLTRSQADALRNTRGVRSVFPDASVKVASVAIERTSTVADNFDAVSYTNNDGSHRWSTHWTE